jgi:hypothetical protein
MLDYEKMDINTLKMLFDEYKKMENNKRAELRVITAEIELIEAFLDHASKCIYKAEQFVKIENEKPKQ